MIGAIIGDIVGSRFEFNNTDDLNFELFTDECSFTDDSICTLLLPMLSSAASVMRKALDSGVLLIRTPWERMAAASHAGLPQAIQSPTTASETVLQCACLQ